MATERKVPRALEQIAALVLQHELACPKRTNGHENALAEIDSQQCRASASIPTASLHADGLGMVDVDARQILDEDADA